MPEPIDRREVREWIEQTQKYWAAQTKGEVSTGGIADAVIALLAEKGIPVVDSDIS